MVYSAERGFIVLFVPVRREHRHSRARRLRRRRAIRPGGFSPGNDRMVYFRNDRRKRDSAVRLFYRSARSVGFYSLGEIQNLRFDKFKISNHRVEKVVPAEYAEKR